MIVVMPMAGRGSRFNGSEYQSPKPLINVFGKPMFIHALESIKGINYSKLIIITLKEHQEKFNVSELLEVHGVENAELVIIDQVTEGQLCTVLAARHFFDQLTEDILIVSSDTLIVSEIGKDISQKDANCEGIISVKNMLGDNWSFAKTDSDGNVIEVAEKVRISNNASTGIYYFSNAKQFCEIADHIITSNERTKGEFYVIPVYQKIIQKGGKVKTSQAQEMWDMGTPDALKIFLDSKK